MGEQLDLFDAIEENPPFARDSETSKAAALSLRSEETARLSRQVLEYLRSRGDVGATDEEGQEALWLSGDTYRPRRWELYHKLLVRDSLRTRPTRSGRQATVWIAAKEQP